MHRYMYPDEAYLFPEWGRCLGRPSDERLSGIDCSRRYIPLEHSLLSENGK